MARSKVKRGTGTSIGEGVRLNWEGAELLKRAGGAAEAGARETLEACVERAKTDHGWQSETGTAEESIQVGRVERTGAGVEGEWGSYGKDALYFIWLETGSSSIEADDTLRRSADAEYPKLAEKIRANLDG